MAIQPNRQRIINLINDYIYTNGNQRITAEQLNEILIDIANSYALEGAASEGIDAVIAKNPNVANKREILNANGGKLELSGEILVNGRNFKYIGLNSIREDYNGYVYSTAGTTSIGNRKSPDAPTNLRNAATAEEANLMALTVYNVEGKESVQDVPNGITSIVKRSGMIDVISAQTEFGIRQSVNSNNIGYEIVHELNHKSIESSVSGPQTSRHTVYVDSVRSVVEGERTNFTSVLTENYASWYMEPNYHEIVQINGNGLQLCPGKKISIRQQDTWNATSGIATLVNGGVSVSTNQVLSNSRIILTVQEEGVFTGNIRIKSKTPGSGFDIASSVTTDSCTVFWQIIDLL